MCPLSLYRNLGTGNGYLSYFWCLYFFKHSIKILPTSPPPPPPHPLSYLEPLPSPPSQKKLLDLPMLLDAGIYDNINLYRYGTYGQQSEK